MREIWMRPARFGDTSAVRTPSSIGVALAITSVVTVVLGVLPTTVLRFADLADIAGAFGG
jgi:energy-converting hydrogenase Eha subunit A